MEITCIQFYCRFSRSVWNYLCTYEKRCVHYCWSRYLVSVKICNNNLLTCTFNRRHVFQLVNRLLFLLYFWLPAIYRFSKIVSNYEYHSIYYDRLISVFAVYAVAGNSWSINNTYFKSDYSAVTPIFFYRI